jgi:hypothetical protein
MVSDFWSFVSYSLFIIPDMMQILFRQFAQVAHSFAIDIFVPGFLRLPPFAWVSALGEWLGNVSWFYLSVWMTVLFSETYRQR